MGDLLLWRRQVSLRGLSVIGEVWGEAVYPFPPGGMGRQRDQSVACAWAAIVRSVLAAPRDVKAALIGGEGYGH